MNPPKAPKAPEFDYNRRFRHLSDPEFREHIERALYNDEGQSRMALMEAQQREILEIVSNARALFRVASVLLGIVTPVLAIWAFIRGR
jgi:hypothetical protein